MAMDVAADRRRRDEKFELVQRVFLLYDLFITSLIELNVHVLTDIVDDGRTVGRYVLTAVCLHVAQYYWPRSVGDA